DIELPGNVLRSRRSVAESGIVLVKKFVIETCAHNFARALFDFADVNQHSRRWVHRPREHEISHVITTASVARIRFRPEGAQVFSIAPIALVQTARRRELEAFDV